MGQPSAISLRPVQAALVRAKIHKETLMQFKNELKKRRHGAAASQQPEEADRLEESEKSTQVADVN